MKLTQALNRAFAAYQAGQFVEAEQICQKIVSAKNNFFDGHHLLAIVAAALGKAEPALASYNRALALQPNHPEALNNRGNILKDMRRFDEALKSYDRALAARPGFFEAMNNRGVVLFELRRFEDAIASCDRALALRPTYAEAFHNRGNALNELNRFAEALESYDRALVLKPYLAETFCNRGSALRGLKRFDEALESCDRALALRPNFADALDTRANVLRELKRYGEALESHDRAIALRPNLAGPISNRGNTLRELKRLDEALASYDRAVALQPDFAEVFSNRGMVLYELNRLSEGLESCERALALQPDQAEAHWNKANLKLVSGDFNAGWPEYEWRWEKEVTGSPKRNFPQPLWLGAEDISGKTILLHCEQGLGDTIQFCRYVPLVAARGARVILEVQKPLQGLIAGLTGGASIVARGEPLPEFDVHCPLLSLPLAFKTQLETVPSATPYLHATPDALTHWGAKLGEKRGPRIGLVWSGNATHVRDGERSISLRAMLPLLNADATFVSLQKEVRAEDAALLKDSNVLNFSDEIGDFSDTAALVSHMDLVISVDTSVAHLAGALGRPVWVLVTYMPDWRWLLDRADSPWYPTARLFRQNETRTWDNALASVKQALSGFVAT